jgi:hypothetical protein
VHGDQAQYNEQGVKFGTEALQACKAPTEKRELLYLISGALSYRKPGYLCVHFPFSSLHLPVAHLHKVTPCDPTCYAVGNYKLRRYAVARNDLNDLLEVRAVDTYACALH